MNPLGDALPRAIRIGGEDYPVRWQWRDCIRIILAFESRELTQGEKMALTLELLYEKSPPISGTAFEKAMKFLNCGETGEGGGEAENGRLYSFEQDARFIYAAFRQSHGIDLATATLHWWEFCWLFLDLREDCFFCRLVGLRSRKRQGKLSPGERQQMAGMEGLLALPEQYSPEEEARLKQFLQAIG